MDTFDSNRNGRLDPLELADQNEFLHADVNRDGALNIQEFARVESMDTFF